MDDTKRILVIDDEPSALDLLMQILVGAGYEVRTATNGLEGLDAFRHDPSDLVITDIVMPVKDGLQTILELRKLAPEVPVIAISGGGTIAKERYLAVAGYLDNVVAIAKPFEVRELVAAVERLLTKAGPQQSPQ